MIFIPSPFPHADRESLAEVPQHGLIEVHMRPGDETAVQHQSSQALGQSQVPRNQIGNFGKRA